MVNLSIQVTFGLFHHMFRQIAVGWDWEIRSNAHKNHMKFIFISHTEGEYPSLKQTWEMLVKSTFIFFLNWPTPLHDYYYYPSWTVGWTIFVETSTLPTPLLTLYKRDYSESVNFSYFLTSQIFKKIFTNYTFWLISNLGVHAKSIS